MNNLCLIRSRQRTAFVFILLPKYIGSISCSKMPITKCLQKFTFATNTAEFKELQCSEFTEYISDEWVNVENEDAVFNAVLHWIKHDPDERRADFADILKHVRLPFCTKQYLASVVNTCDLVNPHCRKYVTEALQFQLDGTNRCQMFNSRTVARHKYQNLLIFGGITVSGKSTTSCESIFFCDKNETWKELELLPGSDRQLCSACVMESYVIVTGGIDSHGVCMMYNMVNRTCKEMPSLTIKRFRHSSVLIYDNIYVLGGQVDDYDHLNEHRPIASVERLSIKQHQWSAAPDMPQPMLFPIVTAYNNYLYVFGGIGGDKEAVSHTWKYDLVNEVWHTLADMPQCSLHSAAVVLNDFIYVVGGYTPLCLRYDPSMDTWTYRSSPLHPHGGGAAVVWQGRILLVGGRNPKTISNRSILL